MAHDLDDFESQVDQERDDVIYGLSRAEWVIVGMETEYEFALRGNLSAMQALAKAADRLKRNNTYYRLKESRYKNVSPYNP